MSRLMLIVVLCVGLASCQKDTTLTDQVAAQQVIDTTLIHNYLAAKGLSSVAKKDKATGEFYIIDTLGTGSPLFTSSTLITVGYTGNVLGSTTIFAQTNNYHPSFTLGQVITGWQIGIPYVKKGGTIRLFIPSQYAYGATAQTTLGIPANSVLDFTIKLYDIAN